MIVEYQNHWNFDNPEVYTLSVKQERGPPMLLVHIFHTHTPPKEVTEEIIEAMSLFELGKFKGQLKADLNYFKDKILKSQHADKISQAISQDIQLLEIVKTAIKQKLAQEQGRSLCEALQKLKLPE